MFRTPTGLLISLKKPEESKLTIRDMVEMMAVVKLLPNEQSSPSILDVALPLLQEVATRVQPLRDSPSYAAASVLTAFGALAFAAYGSHYPVEMRLDKSFIRMEQSVYFHAGLQWNITDMTFVVDSVEEFVQDELAKATQAAKLINVASIERMPKIEAIALVFEIIRPHLDFIRAFERSIDEDKGKGAELW